MIDGKRLVIIMLAIVVTIGVFTYGLYLLTRPDVETTGLGAEFVPNAVNVVSATSYYLIS